MSQIPIENDDNRSIPSSDFVKLEQPDEVPDQEQQQQQGQSQFGLHQSLDWTLETGSTHNNNENGLKEMKWMMANLQAKIETLQANVKNLELEAKIRAMEENAEQNAKYQALETKFAQMLTTQSEEHRKEMAQLKDGFAKEIEQLEAKNLQLEEKLMSNAEMQTTGNGALDAKIEQLQDEFSKKLAEQQKQTAQFQTQFHSLEQKLKEAEQRAQTGKNQLEEIIQQKMEKFREEMDQNGQQAIGSNLNKLDFMWNQLMSKILANPKGIVWDRSKMKASSISECGLKTTNTCFGWIAATEGYAISGEHCRIENFQFPGTIVFYYEVTITSSEGYWHSVGFTDGSKPPAVRIGGSPNSYGIKRYNANKYSLWLSGKEHKLECPTGTIAEGGVLGCGLLLNSKNELAVFFTLNGILLVKQTPINPTVDRLYPTVYIFYASVEANFGDNLVAKPFKFDIGKCPGLVFE